MDIHVGFWLTWLLLITVVIWVADRILKLRDRPGAVGSIVDTSNSLISVFFLVLVVRSFVVEPFTIPSGSMLPTLHVHDFILVNKFAYGLRLPVTDTKILSVGEPKRGDVMVFRYPKNPNEDFIKRVIGLPGDHIAVRDNVVYVNGKEVGRKLVGQEKNSQAWRREYVEDLDGHKHLIWQQGPVDPFSGQLEIPSRTQGEWTVPPGHYFVMGDNRDNSNDSRFWGTVPEKLIVGKAFYIWMHWKPLFSLPSFSRNGPLDKEDDIRKLETETQQ